MITLLPEERIVLERRAYWLPIALEAFVSLLVALLPLAALLGANFLPSRIEELILTYEPYALFIAVAWFFVSWVLFFVAWTNYYLVVTNKRVIDIQQIGLFARDIAEIRTENIEDLRVEIVGPIASLLHFGNLHIQSAGESREFVMRNIPDPHKVREAISCICDEAAKKK